MRCTLVIDEFIEDMTSQGRLNSEPSRDAYRDALYKHAADVNNRDPRFTTREDVKVTLRRWKNPNTRRHRQAILISFYDWMEEEAKRKDNPARQVRRSRHKATTRYRLTDNETQRVLRAAQTTREKRCIYIPVMSGLRRAELLGMQGKHFERTGWIWVSEDIGKGHKERWIPVLPELEPVVAEIQEHCELDDYIIPAQRVSDPGTNLVWVDTPKEASGPNAVYKLVKHIGERAGIAAPISPHTLRHAFADHIADQVDVRTAQHLLGHSSLQVTQTYLRTKPRLDDLAKKVASVSFGVDPERVADLFDQSPANPDGKPGCIEHPFQPVQLVVRVCGINPADPNKPKESK